MSNAALRKPAAVTIVVAIVAACFLWLLSAAPAYAEAGDRISSFDVAYVVNADGSVGVTETITYEFAGYGRHGIYRSLLTKAPYDDDRDRLYRISGFSVSSPTGAATMYSESQQQSDDGRSEYTSYQIGSATAYVDDSETYVLRYRLEGALNPQGAADTEFFWNVTGNDSAAELGSVSVSVSVPGGATKVDCVYGPAGIDESCDEATIDSSGAAQFNVADVGAGERTGVTIAVGIPRDQVQAPLYLQDAPSYLRANGFTPVNLGLAGAGVAAVAGVGEVVRRRGRDLRFVGVPPGVVPDANQLATRGNGVKVSADKGDIVAPVAFSPPRDVSPAEASYLRRPGLDDDQLSSTLLDLAYRGAIEISGGPAGSSTVNLVDRSRATRPFETGLLDAMFSDGQSLDLTTPRVPGVVPPLHNPAQGLRLELAQAVESHKWFSAEIGQTRRGLRFAGIGLGVIGGVLLVMSLVAFSQDPAAEGSGMGVWAAAMLAAGVVLWSLARVGNDQGRSAMGTAVMDQINGFELYLTTAEADQLKFEAGEDIFSKYLPWAVVFDITERWTQICGELSRAGRIPAQPTWYHGSWNPGTTHIWVNSFNNDVGSATSPPIPIPPPPSSSGGGGNSGFSGFSGGSSFGGSSGGGFSSGGGGGGGGTGSW